jgi:Family of unknown function (DUF6069)
MKVNTARILRAGAIGALIGSIANLIIWFIALQTGLTLSVPAMDPSMADASGMMQVSFIAVILATTITTFIGGGVLAIFNRISANPVRLFQIVAGVFVLVSMVGVLEVPATGDKISLGLMHIVAGIVAVWVYTTQTRK